MKCEFLFSPQLLSGTFLIPRTNEREVIKNAYWSPCKVPLFLSDFNENLNFATDFGKHFTDKIS